MSDNNNVTELPLSDDAPIAESTADKRGPGRPKGTTKAKKEEAKPLTQEPPPKPKKRPEDIKDPYAAINSAHERMAALVKNLREQHPESEVSDPINPLDVKKVTKGAPMEKTAFHAPIIGITRLAGWLGDLPPEEMPKQEAYDRCAESWARTSTHLGLSEKGASLFSSISETVYVVGFTFAKSIKRIVSGPAAKSDEQLEAAGGPPEAPTSKAAPLSDDRVPIEPPKEEPKAPKKPESEDLDEQSYR